MRTPAGPAALLAVLVVSCGGSPSSPPPPASIQFTPALTPPAANSVSLQAAGSSATSLTVDVVATSVTNLSTLFFDVVFDPAILQFQSATTGAFFSSQGSHVEFDAALDTRPAAPPGHVVVFASTLPATTGVGGSGVVCAVNFTRVAAGSGGLSFANTGALKPGVIADPTVTFRGGSVVVP